MKMPSKLSRFLGNEKARTQLLSGLTIAMMMVVAVSGMILMTGEVKASGPSTWYNADWSYCREIWLQDSAINGNLSNFPVTIEIDFSGINDSKTQDNGNDILFALGDGTKLSHEIDGTFDETSTNIFYVNVTSLTDGQNNSIFMYYGNPAASNQEDPEGVWDSDFVGVWHMNDNTTSDIVDSTSYGNDGVKNASNNPIETTGVIGDAQSFDGTDDRIEVPYDSSLEGHSALTVSAWVYWNGSGTGEYRMAVNNYRNAFDNRHGFYFGKNDNDGFQCQVRDNNELYTNVDSWAGFSPGNWYYMCMVFDGSGPSMVLYANGSAVMTTSTADATTMGTTGRPLVIGDENAVSPDEKWPGYIDEVRYSKVARSANWVSTSYNFQSDPSGSIQVGPELTNAGSGTPSAPTGATATAYTNFDISLSGLDANSRITFPTATVDDTTGDIVWANETSYGILTVSNDGVQQINLSWTKGSGATKTVIRRDTTSHATWTLSTGSLLANITDNYYNIGSLSPGTHYYFALWSWNSSGYSETYATCDAIVGNASVTNLTIHIEDVGSGTALVPKENFTLYGNASGSYASLGAFDATSGNITLTTSYAGLPLAIGDKLYFEFKAIVGAGAQPNGTYYDKNAQTLDCYVKADR